jgi:opacity protein-like surface antigen
MNQKSSLREDLKFVSWMLTGNTLYAQAGYQNSNYSVFGRGVTADGWNIAGQLRYFVQSNFMIALKAGYADLSFDNAFGNGADHSAWKIGAKTEYRFNASPFSVFAEVDYRDGRFKVAGVDMKEQETRAMLGAKWNFGSQTLFQRDRNGASLDPMQSLLPPAIMQRGPT